MRVLVCGSRSFDNEFVVWDVLTGIFETQSCGWLTVEAMPLTVIEGCAAGADAAAENWVHHSPLHGPEVDLATYDPVTYDGGGHDMPVALLKFPAQWSAWGSKAGYIRNRQMLEEGKPDVVWAFVDKPLPSSRGTAMMCKIAREAGVPVNVVQVLT